MHPVPGETAVEHLSKISLISFTFHLDKSPRPPLKEKKVQRFQESTCFSAELDIPALPKTKRVARMPKISPAGMVLEAPGFSLPWLWAGEGGVRKSLMVLDFF